METLLSEFLPTSWTAPSLTPPQSAYGFPLASAMKLLRVVATSGRHACARLVSSEVLRGLPVSGFRLFILEKLESWFNYLSFFCLPSLVKLFWSDWASVSSVERRAQRAAPGGVGGSPDHCRGLQAVGCSSWIWAGLQIIHVSKHIQYKLVARCRRIPKQTANYLVLTNC